MKRIKINDGSVWPDPKCTEFESLAWRLRYAHDSLSQTDFYNAAEILGAYRQLTVISAMEVAGKKISGIRAENKRKEGE